MEFRMLGQPELWADGMRHDLGPRKERTVLAVLLYELPRAVPAETLVSRVWGDDPPDGVYNSLYSVVSRLRKRLGDASGLDGEALLPKRSGRYVLNVSRDQVDLWQFRALRDQARRAIGRDDELVVTLFNRAEALWRGAPLDGLDGDWAEAVRVTLGEERLSAALQCFRAGQRLGREADQVSDIAKLMDEYPGNENLLELYLLALYRSGRQPMALMTYRQAEQRWRDEYGMDLGSGLRDLQRLMLTADPILDAAPPSQESSRPAVADPVPPPMPPSTMRRDTPDFTGRGAELERLVSWLGLNPARPAAPVVVISGMAGVGKTALAVHAARQLRERYPEQAQVFLSLRANSASDAPVAPGAALGALLRRVGVPDSVIPVDVDDRAALLQFRLTGRNTLIVLDDALDAGQVLPLLPDVPDCMVLVTTRRRALSLPGMLAIQLDPMPHADAAALFARTAGASAGQAADQASVSRVARLCGRLPLRIRLAGGQLRRHPAWSVRDLASHLSDLGSDDPAMTAEFDLSYRYLTAQEAQLFRWLALHPGDSFSAHAAVALSGGTAPAATERALEVLLDYHLVEEPVPGRYTFHALLREYARGLADRVDSDRDRRLVMGRLLDYYLSLADRADRIVNPFSRRIAIPDNAGAAAWPLPRTRRECRDLLEAEKSSLLAIARYAGTHGFARQAGLFAHLLGGFLDTWGDWAEAISLHRNAVAAWRAAGDAGGTAVALTDLALMLSRTGQHVEAAGHARDGVSAARAASDPAAEAAALDVLGIVLALSARYAEALTAHDQALAIWRALGDRHGEADALSHSGMSATRLGRRPDALRRAELALAAYRELGDLQGATNTLNNLGAIQQDAGCHDEALASYEEAKAAFLELGDRQGEAIALSNIGDIRRLTGSHREAVRSYREALNIFWVIGDRRSETETLNGMAGSFARAGDYQAALDNYKKALVLANELAERHAQATSHLGLGEVHLATGRQLLAADDYRVALELSRQIADPVQEGRALYGLGCALQATEGITAAQQHWRAALSVFEAMGTPEADNVRARLTATAGG